MSQVTEPAFTKLTDLAAAKFGGKAICCTDDFFASMDNLIQEGRGIFIPEKYTEQGKWMDGWESRRKRIEGHDWCIVKLGAKGTIRGVDIDTNHFLGNHPPFASIEAIALDGDPSIHKLNDKALQWQEILPKSALNPGSQHYFVIENEEAFTHVKLHIYPDGGVARLKVYGEVAADWTALKKEKLMDLAAAQNGALAVLCNDMFFSHMQNLLMPGRGKNMGDGWETKRNRTPNNRDWVVIQLAKKGTIQRVMIDTAYFKGNYPDSFSLEGTIAESAKLDQADWVEMLPKQKLAADCELAFDSAITNHGPFTHVRLNIYPDGGVSRLRLWGKPE